MIINKPATMSLKTMTARHIVPSILSALMVCISVILGASGAAKLISLFSGAAILTLTDPLFKAPIWLVYTSFGLVELYAAWVIVKNPASYMSLLIISILGMEMSIYRFVSQKINYSTIGCPCLGSLGEMLGLNQQQSAALASNLFTAFSCLWVLTLLLHMLTMLQKRWINATSNPSI